MGNQFQIDDGYRIKYEMKEYPWPCKQRPNRTITIYDDDVLTIEEDGTCMKHTGMGCFGIEIPRNDLVPWDNKLMLEII